MAKRSPTTVQDLESRMASAKTPRAAQAVARSASRASRALMGPSGAAFSDIAKRAGGGSSGGS